MTPIETKTRRRAPKPASSNTPRARELAKNLKAQKEIDALRTEPWSFFSQKSLAQALRAATRADIAAGREAYHAHAGRGGKGLADLLSASDAIEMLSTGKLELCDTSWGRMASGWTGIVNPVATEYERRNPSAEPSTFCVDATSLPLEERVALAGALDTWRGRFGSRSGMHPLDLVKAASIHDPSLAASIERALFAAIGLWAKSAAHMRNNNDPVGARMASARKLLDAHGTRELKAKFELAMAPFSRPKASELTPAEILSAKKQQAWMRAFRGGMELDVPEVLKALYAGALAHGVDPLAPDAKIASGRIQRTLLGLACEIGSSECAAWLCGQNAPTGAVAAGDSFLNASNPYLSLAIKCMEASAQNTFTAESQKSWEKAFGAVEARMAAELPALGLPPSALSDMRAMVESLPEKIKAGALKRDTQSVSGIIPSPSLSLVLTRSWEPDYPIRIGQSQAIFSRAAIKSAIGEHPGQSAPKPARL